MGNERCMNPNTIHSHNFSLLLCPIKVPMNDEKWFDEEDVGFEHINTNKMLKNLKSYLQGFMKKLLIQRLRILRVDWSRYRKIYRSEHIPLAQFMFLSISKQLVENRPTIYNKNDWPWIVQRSGTRTIIQTCALSVFLSLVGG